MRTLLRIGMFRVYCGKMWWWGWNRYWEQYVIQIMWRWCRPIFIPLSRKKVKE